MSNQAALIIAIGIAAAGLAVGGIYKPITVGNGDSAGAYIVNRFTGTVFVCGTDGRTLSVSYLGVICGSIQLFREYP